MGLKVSGTVATAVAALLAAACPLMPSAVADAGAPVLIQSRGVLCALSTNDAPRGGGPTAVCQLSGGGPFPQAPFSNTKPNPKLNLAVVRGGGQFQWDLGSVAGGQPIDLAPGQTFHANGWTIYAENPTRIVNDASGHGMRIDPDLIRQT